MLMLSNKKTCTLFYKKKHNIIINVISNSYINNSPIHSFFLLYLYILY